MGSAGRVPHEVPQDFGRPGDRSAQCLQHLGHAGGIDAISDFQRRELGVFDDRRKNVSEQKIGFRVELSRHDRSLFDDTFLKPAARGLGGFAFSQVGEEKDETDGPVQRGEDRVGTNQKRRHRAAGARDKDLSTPGTSVHHQIFKMTFDLVRIGEQRQ